ncbi:MAG: hypothetical protein JWM10_754 [Myxococcaceae bacterium]|nr:hypothetical protein [Myxococcaceae bacterium]
MSKNSTQNTNNGNGANRVVPVVFLHPREGGVFEADVGPTTTGQAAIDGLIGEKFISAPDDKVSYGLQLQRTGKTIPLAGPMVEAGVMANDRVAVIVIQSGA